MGATSGLSAGIRYGLCRPRQRHEESWDIYHGAQTCPPMTDTRLPRPSDRRHLFSYGRYRRLGPGAGARGGGARGCRAPKKVGRGGEGEGGSEVWIGESGGSDATSDAEMEDDEGILAPLTASPWDTQESGGRGLQGDARDGGSDDGKGTSATADRGETRGRHGALREQGKKRRPRGMGRGRNLGSGGKLWGS